MFEIAIMAHGSWLMAHGSWLMAHGSWRYSTLKFNLLKRRINRIKKIHKARYVNIVVPCYFLSLNFKTSTI